MTLGEFIKNARLMHCITQEELARKSHISRATIVRVENGTIKPTIITIRKLAKGLHCEVANLTNLLKE